MKRNMLRPTGGRRTCCGERRDGAVAQDRSHNERVDYMRRPWLPSRRRARKVFGWPKRCRLAHAFPREYRCKGLGWPNFWANLASFSLRGDTVILTESYSNGSKISM